MEFLFVVVLGAGNILNPNFHVERMASQDACWRRVFEFVSHPDPHIGPHSAVYCVPIPAPSRR